MVAQHNVGSIGSRKRPVAIKGLVTSLFQVSTFGSHAAFTPVAFHAWRGDREHHTLAKQQIWVAGGANDTDSLVAENAGARCAAAAEHGVTVGATDGGGGDFYQGFAFLQSRNRHFLHAKVATAVPDKRLGLFRWRSRSGRC